MSRKLIAGAAVLALAAASAAPAALGWQAERTYMQIVDRVNADNPDMEISIDDVERGWLVTDVRYTITVSGPYNDAFQEITDSDQPLVLTGRDHVRHGPWIEDGPAIARVDSEIRMTEALRALGQEAVADGPVLTARSVIDLGGDVRSHFRVPDHRFEATASADDDRIDNLTVAWRDVTGEAGLEGGLTRVMMQAGELTLESDQGDHLALTDIELGDRSRRSTEGLWIGRAYLDVGEVRIVVDDADNPLDFRGEGITAENAMDTRDGHAALDSRFAFERAVANGFELSDARATVRVEQLEREPLARLQTLMGDLQRDLEPGQELTGEQVPEAEIRAAVGDLLKGSPRLESDELQVHTPDGRITGDLRVGFDGQRSFDLDIPVTLLGPLSGHLELYVPRALVRNGLYASMREQVATGEFSEEMQERLRNQVNQVITLLVGTGLIREEQGRLVVRLDKEAGGPALVNDREVMQMVQAIASLMEQ